MRRELLNRGFHHNAEISRVVLVLGDGSKGAGDFFFEFDEAVPGVVGGRVGFVHLLGLGNRGHVADGVVGRVGPGAARRVGDIDDLIDRVGGACLFHGPSGAVVGLFEAFPVAGGVEVPVLLERGAGEGGLGAFEYAPVGGFQALEAVVGVEPVVFGTFGGGDRVLAPDAFAGSIVAVLDAGEVSVQRESLTRLKRSNPV